MAIYMKYGSIDGAVTTEGFSKWIEVNSFQWGTGRAISSASRGANRESSEPSLSEVVVTKENDVASTKLFQEAVAGELKNKVEVKFTTTTKNKVETFLTYEFENAGVSSYSVSSGGSDHPIESISINFSKITITPSPLDHAGNIKKGAVVSYDLLTMKKS